MYIDLVGTLVERFGRCRGSISMKASLLVLIYNTNILYYYSPLVCLDRLVCSSNYILYVEWCSIQSLLFSEYLLPSRVSGSSKNNPFSFVESRFSRETSPSRQVPS
jgi:hypothetical protein